MLYQLQISVKKQRFGNKMLIFNCDFRKCIWQFGWMEILQKMSSESCPVELRHAVAQVLKNQWTLVKNDCSLMQQYWLLTLTLLQDPVESVRNEMAKSISIALSKEMTLYPGIPLVR